MPRRFMTIVLLFAVLWTGTLLHDSLESDVGMHGLETPAASHRLGGTDESPQIALEEHWHGPYSTIRLQTKDPENSWSKGALSFVTSVRTFHSSRIAVSNFASGRPPPVLQHPSKVPTFLFLCVQLI
jgi:hypothetical protein